MKDSNELFGLELDCTYRLQKSTIYDHCSAGIIYLPDSICVAASAAQIDNQCTDLFHIAHTHTFHFTPSTTCLLISHLSIIHVGVIPELRAELLI